MPMQAVKPGTDERQDYIYRGRTYSTPDDNHHGFMGPTLRVTPGQSLWIKLRNNMTSDGDDDNDGENGKMGPPDVSVEDYWRMLQKPGEKIKYQFYKKSVDDPSKMVVDEANLPHDFDSTNLHLHGLDIEVHMFDPVGTTDPTAPHVKIDPGQCYCYRFNVPQDHPGGLYWYHPHVHGSTAIQMWSGMLGLLYVDGPLEAELAEYGITQSEEFVIWDPAFRQVDDHNGTKHNLEVDEFLMGQTTLSKIHPFLVNGKVTPNFDVAGVGDVLHLRTLVGIVENENTFIVYKEGDEHLHWDEAAIPFWVIASDGVTYSKPRKKNILVMAGGQREEILLQFDEPGRYVISQQGIQGMQFFDMWGHPHDQILATITVGTGTAPPTTKSSSSSSSQRLNTPISEMTFTPGYKEEDKIQAHDIVKTENIVFSMGANRNQAPFPQYFVNGRPFHPDEIRFRAHPGEAVEYVLINANHNVHPFHIHVNRFQIQEMGSELSTERYPVLSALLDHDPTIWRDIVIVPPNGRARIWVHYKSNYTGKTVLHCHFLAHEDTGMMSTIFIGDEDVVFTWKDYKELLVGLACGILLTGIILLVVRNVARDDKQLYEQVLMNEMKSKAVD
jgi:FtsP/CotA-like multicopper oxidase with cupredoxin domain